MRSMRCEATAVRVIRMIRTYSKLIRIPSFEERYRYLKLCGKVGEETFGFKRWLNQEFYHSDEWLRFRDRIIIRDNGCDLAVDGFVIHGPIIIHHLNPITYEDIRNRNPCVFDPDNVVSTKLSTHNAIHYGDETLLQKPPVERVKNDTCPWRQ